MATTGGHLRRVGTTPHRTTQILILVFALAIGLLIGGVLGRVTASSGSANTASTNRVNTGVEGSDLTRAEQSQLAQQVRAVTSRRMQEWERACSSKQHPSADVC